MKLELTEMLYVVCFWRFIGFSEPLKRLWRLDDSSVQDAWVGN